MRQHPGRCDCSRSKCLYRAIIDPWLTIETHNGRLDQGIMDLMLPVIQAKPNTTQGRLHLGCLHLPAKVCDTVAKEHHNQGGLLAAREIGKLT